MKENMTDRVGRIISGSLNALIDAVENTSPEMLMTEAIREIDGVTDDVRAELGKVVAQKHLANQRLIEENQRHEDFSRKIELAIQESREDLAEVAIAAQLDIEAQIPILESTILDCGSKEKELEGYVAALNAKKREMKEDLKDFKHVQQQQEEETNFSNDGVNKESTLESRVNKAESAFERVIENATGVVGRVKSNDANAAVKIAELDALDRSNRIHERLKAIKNRTKDEK